MGCACHEEGVQSREGNDDNYDTTFSLQPEGWPDIVDVSAADRDPCYTDNGYHDHHNGGQRNRARPILWPTLIRTSMREQQGRRQPRIVPTSITGVMKVNSSMTLE